MTMKTLLLGVMTLIECCSLCHESAFTYNGIPDASHSCSQRCCVCCPSTCFVCDLPLIGRYYYWDHRPSVRLWVTEWKWFFLFSVSERYSREARMVLLQAWTTVEEQEEHLTVQFPFDEGQQQEDQEKRKKERMNDPCCSWRDTQNKRRRKICAEKAHGIQQNPLPILTALFCCLSFMLAERGFWPLILISSSWSTCSFPLFPTTFDGKEQLLSSTRDDQQSSFLSPPSFCLQGKDQRKARVLLISFSFLFHHWLS